MKIVNDRLRVAYSLGDDLVTEFGLDDEISNKPVLSVSDGKWRIVRLEYANRRFRLSVDNDGLDEVNACELARNARANTTDPRAECLRVEHEVKLPEKCSNQIENCYRYEILSLMLG